MDERLAPETRAVGSYKYFTGIIARIECFCKIN